VGIYPSIFEYLQLAADKILVPRYMFHPKFCAAGPGVLVNDTAAFLSGADGWMMAVLNSPAFWYFAFHIFPHKKDETVAMDQRYLLAAPVPKPEASQRERVSQSVEEIVQLTRGGLEARAGVLDLLRMEYEVTSPGNLLGSFELLSSDGFVKEVRKRRPKASSLSTAALKALRSLFEAEAPPLLERRARVFALEQTIAQAVHDAWGLNQEDLAELRGTAPPRIPPGWNVGEV